MTRSQGEESNAMHDAPATVDAPTRNLTLPDVLVALAVGFAKRPTEDR